METIRTIMYLVWTAVGVTVIGSTIYYIRWASKFYKGFYKTDKEA